MSTTKIISALVLCICNTFVFGQDATTINTNVTINKLPSPFYLLFANQNQKASRTHYHNKGCNNVNTK